MTQVQDAPVYDDTAANADGEGSNRRNLVLLGVLAAVLLGAAGWFLLGGSGDAEESFAVPVRKPVTQPSVAPKPVETVPPVSTVKIGRDPFKPGYVVPPPPAPPAVVLPGIGTGGTDGASGGTGGGTGGGTDTPVATTYPLKLERVDGTGGDLTAKFLVGSEKKIQFARAGSVFGKTGEIRLLSIQKGPNGTGTAVIQVGDDSPFDVSTSDGAIFVQ